ncbi:MAG: hypothetical protein AB2L24_11790 [Mangrovibacterium sp.]
MLHFFTYLFLNHRSETGSREKSGLSISIPGTVQTQHLVLMRVHLQRAGQRGYDIAQSTPDNPYYRNIFAPGSPSKP